MNYFSLPAFAGSALRNLAFGGLIALGLTGLSARLAADPVQTSLGGGSTANNSLVHYNTGSGLSVENIGAPYYIASGSPQDPGSYSATTTVSGSDPNGSGSATQSADLTDGTIKGFISGNGFGASIIDVLNDRVTFQNNTGADAPITVTYTIDGTFDITSGGAFDAFGQLVLGGGFNYQAHLDYANGLAGAVNTASASGWTSYSYAPDGTFGYTFTGVYDLASGTTTLPFQMSLNLAGSDGTADWSHTSAVSLSLPTGVTFSSDSGVFLTASTAAAPEPASVALLATGMLLTAVWTARKRFA